MTTISLPTETPSRANAPTADCDGNGRLPTLPGILPHHYKELHEGSGLSDATIQAAGIYSETDYRKLASLVNRRKLPKKSAAPAWVLPYSALDGRPTGYCQVKFDNPWLVRGKPCKYVSPSNRDPEVYLPPNLADAVSTPKAPLLIGEGGKKGLRATEMGFPCLVLAGVTTWKAKHTERLLPAMEQIKWKDRPVFVCFDSDLAENAMVQEAECRLAALLANQGAIVRVVRLPEGPPGEDGKPAKVGLDDYFLTHTAADFQKLLDAAEEPEKPTAGTVKQSSNEMDPYYEVVGFLAQQQVDGTSPLRFWRGTFHHWKDGGYREKSLEEVRAAVLRYLNRWYTKINSGSVYNVVDQLKAQVMLDYDREPPCWLGKPPRNWAPAETLATKSGLVHLPSLVAGGDYLHPSTPRYFSPAALDYAFDPQAPPPETWLRFLGSLWEEDRDSIACLQEWFGYSLVPDTRLHKIFLVVGPMRSGKGTIARTLRKLIGFKNTCGPTLASLSSNFGLWPLVGKTLAVISDARLGHKIDSHTVVERLLSISGEDPLTVDRKMLEPINYRFLTRLMILSNEIPRLADASGAVASRMIVLPLSQSFLGREDTTLEQKLLPELPGILLWAIEGWRRLRERGCFVQAESGLSMLSDLGDLASPVGAFVRDCCEIHPAANVSRDDLYHAYADWAKAGGRTRVEDRAGFGRNLRAVAPSVRDGNHRVFGRMVRFYEGITLQEGELQQTGGE